MEKMAFDKKLLGLANEKQCENMIALAPKTYSCSINMSKNNSENTSENTSENISKNNSENIVTNTMQRL
jgi:predicted metallo-beta-lactamase superfamily hydrolase